MKKIRFNNQDEREKAYITAVRERVRAYFKDNNISMHGNYKMYLKSVFMLALYFTPFILLLTVPMSLLTAMGMFFLIGVGEAGIGMSVMHDAVHRAYSSKIWVNKIMGSTMFLLGSNTFNWKIQHNIMHHTYTNIYNYDPDISAAPIVRLSDHSELKRYHRYQQYYAFLLYGLMTFSRLFGDMFVLLEHNRQGTTKQQNVNPTLEVIILALTKIIYLGIIFGLPLILTDFTFWQILLGFTVMHVTAGMIMSTVFQMAHVVEGTYQPLPDEHNVINTGWGVHELRSTSDFGRNNGLLSWYIGGLDFQIEHHLFPHVCHIHYPKIATIVEQTTKEFGYYYNLKSSFFSALGSHYRRLKELGSQPVVAGV